MRQFACAILFCFFVSSSHSQTSKELTDSFYFYYKAKNFEKAIPFAEKLTAYFKEKYGTDNKSYSSLLSLLSGMYFGNMDLGKAEPSLLELKEVNQKVFGVNSEEYVKGISMLSILYNRTGRNDKAIPLLAEAMEYYKTSFGDSSYEYASAANKLAKVYEELGDYERALPLFEKATDITEKTKGSNSPEYATILNNLGIVYNSSGHPEKQEPCLLKAAEIRKKLGDEDPDYANSLNNLAAMYVELGQVNKAVDYYNKAAAIYKKSKGETSFEYLTCITNLGSIYDKLGEYDKAEQIYLDALTTARKKYAEDWPLCMNITHNLGLLYLAMEKYDQAGPLVLKNVSLEQKQNDKSIAYSTALNDLAYYYNYTGHKEEAENLYIRSAALTKAAVGENNRIYAATLNNLALFYQEQQQYDKSVPLLTQSITIELNYFLNLFSILSESEKLAYIDRNLYLQNINLAVLYRHPFVSETYCTDVFNTQLFMKSLLLTDSKNVLEAVRSSKDTAVQHLFSQWQNNKKILSKEYALTERERDKNLKELEQEAENEEKELIRNSSLFRNLRKNLDTRMEDVQHNLKDDEAAVEFVNFWLPNTEDSTMYAAFVIRKNDKSPKFVKLFEEKQLTSITERFGKTSKVVVNMLYPGKKEKDYDLGSPSFQLYELMWQPLESSLKGIKKVYYSPTGQLYNIAFHALITDSATLLSDRYSLQQLTSIRDLATLDEASDKKIPSTITLFGDGNFAMDSTQIIYAYKKSAVDVRQRPLPKSDNKKQVSVWPALTGTRDEINGINKLFVNNKTFSKIYTGDDASEENLKMLSGNSPQVLFIATHGFFLPSPEFKKQNLLTSGNVYARADNPLLRSGLILSGGNYVWSGKKPIEGVEDGVVTSYEISQLNLSNTSLVVLSACETGLGDVKITEGVFGLQRAFKLAGVDKLIVSLWKVPDKETSELMTTFFSYWLRGKNVSEAFSLAQADMRKKYPPYYWAAFVLIE